MTREPFYHGTRADLKPDDLIVRLRIEFRLGRKANHMHFTATLDAAI